MNCDVKHYLGPGFRKFGSEVRGLRVASVCQNHLKSWTQTNLFGHIMYRVFFFNWDPPKNHKYGKKLKYLNWDPPKSSKCQPVSKFWHLELL